MFRYFVVVLSVFVATALAEVPLQICGGNIDARYFPNEVRSEHCSDGICHISLTAPIRFEVDATAPFDTEYLNLYASMHYKLPDDLEAVIPVPFPDEIIDGCQGLTRGSCPLEAGEEFTKTIDWDWTPEEVEAGTTFEMQMRIYDQEENIVSCFRVPVELVD